MGGSIPLCNTLTSLYPEAEMLLIGLSEPEAQIHAVNESVSPQELERMSVAEALFLNYAESSAPDPREGGGPHRVRPGRSAPWAYCAPVNPAARAARPSVR
ncbi:hypothetical protein SAVIM40S_07423 [Streptomyces avidinii]